MYFWRRMSALTEEQVGIAAAWPTASYRGAYVDTHPVAQTSR